MDLRRIIKFGTSSFVVSLPKTWVDKNSLNKGDLLFFNENGNNELVISPRDRERKKETSTINIETKNKPLDTIKREIMAAYIGSVDVIKVSGSLKVGRREIDDLLHRLLALEIMEDTPNKIVIKDFLNVGDISLSEIIRRMDVMLRTILDDVECSFKKSRYDKISQFDKSVNKLMFLIFRVVRKGLGDPDVLKALKLSNPTDLLYFWLVADRLEGIADECRRITRFLKMTKLSKDDEEKLTLLYINTKEIYLEIMKALYISDANTAHKIASQINDKMCDWESVFIKSDNKIIGSLVEKFKAVDGQIRNIARVVVDRSLKNESDTKAGS